MSFKKLLWSAVVIGGSIGGWAIYESTKSPEKPTVEVPYRKYVSIDSFYGDSKGEPFGPYGAKVNVFADSSMTRDDQRVLYVRLPRGSPLQKGDFIQLTSDPETRTHYNKDTKTYDVIVAPHPSTIVEKKSGRTLADLMTGTDPLESLREDVRKIAQRLEKEQTERRAGQRDIQGAVRNLERYIPKAESIEVGGPLDFSTVYTIKDITATDSYFDVSLQSGHTLRVLRAQTDSDSLEWAAQKEVLRDYDRRIENNNRVTLTFKPRDVEFERKTNGLYLFTNLDGMSIELRD